MNIFLLLFYRKLRTLRVANNPLLSDKAFPSSVRRDPSPTPSGSSLRDKPLPLRPTTWLEQLPPLILRHKADNMRVLDVSDCKITDSAIEGIISHAPRIQSLNLTKCSMLTDAALDCVAKLGDHLDVLIIAHVKLTRQALQIETNDQDTPSRPRSIVCKKKRGRTLLRPQ